MKKEKIWLSPPHMGGNELKYIQNAFDTNWTSQYGSNIDEFENNLEDYLGKIGRKINQRRKNHDFYQHRVKNHDNMELFSTPNSDFYSNYWLNTVVLKNNLLKEKLKEKFSQNNIETRYLWKPMHLQSLYKGYNFFGYNLSGTLFDAGLCLSSGTNLTDDCRARISEVLQNEIH